MIIRSPLHTFRLDPRSGVGRPVPWALEVGTFNGPLSMPAQGLQVNFGDIFDRLSYASLQLETLDAMAEMGVNCYRIGGAVLTVMCFKIDILPPMVAKLIATPGSNCSAMLFRYMVVGEIKK